MFEILSRTRETIDWLARMKSLRARVRLQVQAEGGLISRLSIIGIMLNTPYTGIGGAPVYLRADVLYAEDAGTWFIREAEGSQVEWVWRSKTGSSSLPVAREDHAWVDNRACALPPWVGVILYILMIFALFGGLAYYLIAT